MSNISRLGVLGRAASHLKQVHQDCEVCGNLAAFDSLGEHALKLLWENGIDPTVAAIAGDASRARDG